MALIPAIQKQAYRKTDLMRASEQQMDAGIGIYVRFAVHCTLFDTAVHPGDTDLPSILAFQRAHVFNTLALQSC